MKRTTLLVSLLAILLIGACSQSGSDSASESKMQEGMVADITILDPETVRDNSTCNHGTLQSTGLPYVLVNRTIVEKDSKVFKDVNPGQPIRFDVQEKGKFGALDLGNWIKNYLADPLGFGGLDC